MDRPRTHRLLLDAARHAVDDDGAEVLVLGCAGLAGAAEAVQHELGVPVLDGVTHAVAFAETFHRLGTRRRARAGRQKPPAVWPVPG